MQNELVHFGEGLAAQTRTEEDLAVALLWYRTRVEGAEEERASELARLMHELSLRGLVNISRLSTRLSRHPDVIRGKASGTFKIRLSSNSALCQQLEPLLGKPRPKLANHIVPSEDFHGTRRYLEKMAEQINGCYQFGFYDGCAVMCRRLMESLLVDVFEKKSATDAIKHKGEYVTLSEIIAQARGGHHFKLARGTADILDLIKEIGDAAAHSRTYITSQKDIDDVKIKFRRMVAELAHLAELSRP